MARSTFGTGVLSTQDNAGDVEVQGLEIELTAQLTEQLSAYATVGIQSGEYTKVNPRAQSFCTNGGTIQGGRCVPTPPSTTSAYVNAIESPFSRKLVDMVIDNAAVRGGCMPSSHFGVGLVIQLFCFKYYRKAAWMILPIVIGLAIGTVWGRFHYVSDVVAGTLIGLGATLGVWWCFPPKKFRGPQRRSNRQDVKTHVS